MSKFNLPVYLLLIIGLFLGPFQGKAATSSAPECVLAANDITSAPGELSSPQLKLILETAMTLWPAQENLNYGTMRSAYNLGTLKIVAVTNPAPHTTPGEAYLVTYDGITVCVIIPA